MVVESNKACNCSCMKARHWPLACPTKPAFAVDISDQDWRRWHADMGALVKKYKKEVVTMIVMLVCMIVGFELSAYKV